MESVAFIEDDSGQIPSVVFVKNESDSHITFGIKKLYGDSMDWRLFSNSYARSSNAFSVSDSFYVDFQKGIGYFRTEKESLSELEIKIDWLAKSTGFVPTWEELQARANRSPNFGRFPYALIAKHQVSELGFCLFFHGSGTDSTGVFWLKLIECSRKEQLVLLTIGYEKTVGAKIDFAVVGEFDKAKFLGKEPPRPPQESKITLFNGTQGEAGLNTATAHCMTEMSYALRVYDHTDQVVWEAKKLIPGFSGVWNCDLDNDGTSEIVVVATEHGNVHVSVYKSTGF